MKRLLYKVEDRSYTAYEEETGKIRNHLNIVSIGYGWEIKVHKFRLRHKSDCYVVDE